MTRATLVHYAVAQVVRGIEQEREGHFEHFGHLEIVRPQLEGRGHEADHRGYPVAGNRHIRVQLSQHLHPLSCKTDLLCRLAQRRFCRTCIPWLGATAREADLSGVVVKMRSTARK